MRRKSRVALVMILALWAAIGFVTYVALMQDATHVERVD